MVVKVVCKLVCILNAINVSMCISCASQGTLISTSYFSGYKITSLVPYGLKQCAYECFVRPSCRSFNYDRDALECELNSSSDTDFPGNLIQTSASIYSNIATWTGFGDACQRSTCSSGEKCVSAGSKAVCIVSECMSPVTGAVTGSYDRGVGSTLQEACTTGVTKNTICTTTGSWSTSQSCYRSYNGWTLVGRFKTGNQVSVDGTWLNTSMNSDTDASLETGCTELTSTSSCSSHYRSGLINEWAGITQVKIALYSGGNETAFITFNATDTNYETWFHHSKIIDSSWTDIKTTTPQIFSMSSYSTRRFYINNLHGGCDNDLTWLVVTQNAGSCFYEKETFLGSSIHHRRQSDEQDTILTKRRCLRFS